MKIDNPTIFAPTPYADVNLVLRELLYAVKAILGDEFVGLYLYGSLATGDFNPDSSDIDFLVVTAKNTEEDQNQAVGRMHERLIASGSKWAKKLEGSYLPLDALRRYDPHDMVRPCLNEGNSYLAQHESDWVIQRHVLRECGVVVAGPPLQDFIEPVSPDAIRRAVLGYLNEWWLPMIENPARLHDQGYQSYAIVSMCRVLHALEYGAIVSKVAATTWAQETLGEKWGMLVAAALKNPNFDGIEETGSFIKYTANQSQSWKCLVGELDSDIIAAYERHLPK